MVLIRCEGCGMVHASTTIVCSECGRCPGCGQRRVSKAELTAHSACSECGEPVCPSCARCHACGALRTIGLPPCECGHPDNPEKLRRMEAAFAFRR